MKQYSLVILAAGMASRFGSPKQIHPVGPAGEWLMEYSMYQALKAGFSRFVIVTRPELESELEKKLGAILNDKAELRFVTQDRKDVPAGCKAPDGIKPLGTAHALWCCRKELLSPFGLINADDYYGQEAFSLLVKNWNAGGGLSMSAYRLDKTLSDFGGVNRGICSCDKNGNLLSVDEVLDIRMQEGRIRGSSLKSKELVELAGSRLVSMSCWGLTPELFPDLEAGLKVFCSQSARTEYYLPDALSDYIASHGAALKVLDSPDSWMGMTYKEDIEALTKSLAVFHAQGLFPSPLWKR